MIGKSTALSLLLAIAAGACGLARSAPAVVLHADLPTLIGRTAGQSERFAVEVPERVSPAGQGQWVTTGSRRVWTYAVQIPTSISMSFHASALTLPPSAILSVSGPHATVQYRAQDIHRGTLWSRPLLGDSLTLSLSVASAEAGRVQLQIDSFQAGYRGLGGAPSHPAYLRFMARDAAAATQSCTQNYSCNATTANQGPANSTVAVLIANQFQCTGTLVNNTSGDRTPYVLTARHCQSGELGGGNPEAAAAVTIYWDAVSPCGTPLGSIYDGSAPGQNSATTIVEQQDAWLIQLDAPPVASDAYWAGWDATGSAFTGGYSVHHALGYNKQYVGWSGKALLEHIPAKTLSVGYDSTFWGVVNQVGSVGAGASGGALFDPANHVVGSSSLAALQNGENSAGVCPITPTPTPTADSITAQYTALSGVFASTADSTSTTGSATLKSVLDPAATGKMVTGGIGNLLVSLVPDQSSHLTLETLTLTWNAPGATSCTASGGSPGDGWAGSKAASGTAQVVNYVDGTVSYSLSCAAGELSGQASTLVDWVYVAPSISLTADSSTMLIGSPVTLSWGSDVGPCVASGGLSGDGWAGARMTNGSQSVAEPQLGAVTYKLTCGSGANTVVTQVVVNVVPMSVSVSADSTKVRVGSFILLLWTSPAAGGTCLGSGGSLANQWTFPMSARGSLSVLESVAGTYNYTVTCTGGGQTASSSVTVIFTNDAPSVSITALSPTQQIYPPTGATPTPDLTWNSNVTGCVLFALGPVGNSLVNLTGKYPGGTAADIETVAGHYVYQLNCGVQQASTSIDWVTPTPAVTLSLSPSTPTTWVAGQQYGLSWTTNTSPCARTGGASGDGWVGTSPAWGSASVTEAAPGNYTFTVTCGTGASQASAQTSITVPAAAVSITASRTTVSTSQTFTLNFSTTVLPCTSVDSLGIKWGGDLSLGGPWSITPPPTPGTYTYAVNCGTGSQSVRAATQVTVIATAPTTITASATNVVVNTPVTITWNSGQQFCVTSGGSVIDGFQGMQSVSGSLVVTSADANTLTYGISCTGSDQAQVQVTYTAPATTPPVVPTPTATLTSNTTTQSIGKNVTLTWSSQNSSTCVTSGGGDGDAWAGSLALSGSMAVTESSAGKYTYTLTCSGAPPAAVANTMVEFTDPNSGGAADSGGGGGGGAVDAWWLLLLPSTLITCRRRLSRTHRHSSAVVGAPNLH